MTRISNSKQLEEYRTNVLADRPADRRVLAVCAGTGCKAYGSFGLIDAFKSAVTDAGMEGELEVRPTGCHGFCERGPLVVIFPEKIFYQRVKPEDASEILEETVRKGAVIERLCYDDPVDGTRYTREEDIPFYRHQKRLLLGQNLLVFRLVLQTTAAADIEMRAARLDPLRRTRKHFANAAFVVLARLVGVEKTDLLARQRAVDEGRLALDMRHAAPVVAQRFDIGPDRVVGQFGFAVAFAHMART